MNHTDLSSVGRKHVHLIELDDDEQIVYEIRKHPVGLLVVYVTGIFVASAIAGSALAAMYFLHGDRLGVGSDLSYLRPIIGLIGVILSVVILGFTAIGAYLYESNVVFITNHKMAQVLYRTLFDRKVSQLSIGDVQDVTTTQKGLFARLFNYGTLIVETAGEQSNYTFTFTPDPYEATKAIINAHEENLKHYGN